MFAANYHTLEVFDRNLNHMRSISDGLMIDLHETWIEGDEIWVTSTAIDAVASYEISSGARTRVFLPRRSEQLRAELGLLPQSLDLDSDLRLKYLDLRPATAESHTHLNAVARWDGRYFALLNSLGAIVDLTDERVVYRHPHLEKGHNLVIGGDGRAIVNDTFRAVIRFIDLEQGRLIRTINVRDFARVRWLQARTRLGTGASILRHASRLGSRRLHRPAYRQIARPLLLRGLAVRDGQAFVGLSPATILEIDLDRGRLVDWFRYATDVRVAVHGLAVAAEANEG